MTDKIPPVSTQTYQKAFEQSIQLLCDKHGIINMLTEIIKYAKKHKITIEWQMCSSGSYLIHAEHSEHEFPTVD